MGRGRARDSIEVTGAGEGLGREWSMLLLRRDDRVGYSNMALQQALPPNILPSQPHSLPCSEQRQDV